MKLENKNFDNRVMLFGLSDKFWIDVALCLKKRGIVLDSIITHNSKMKLVKKLFKNTIILDGYQFSYPCHIEILNKNNTKSLSAKILNDFIKCENLYLTISDRLSFYPLSVKERKKLYQELLLFLYNFIKENKIEAVVFERIPHMGYDNIIYYIAKKLNIKTLMIIRTLIENKVLLINDYELVNKIPSTYLNNYKKIEIVNKIMGEDLYKKIYSDSYWLKRSNKINHEVINKKFLNDELKIKFKSILKSLFSKQFNQIIIKISQKILTLIKNQIFGKSNESTFFLNNGIRNIKKNLVLNPKFNYKIRKLRKYYNSNTSKIDFEKKFVYFALHFQPERSTLPEGGVFENQLLAIDILSKSIPNDWIIYVREHPRTFQKSDFRRQHFRNKKYYDKIISYSNIKLVKIEENAKKLIEKAIFNVTITGTTGWEGLLKNIPCIVFGNPWYSPCNSCYLVSSIDECKKSIESIINKTKNEVELDVLKFICYYKNKFITTATHYDHAVKSNISYNSLVNNLVDNLIKMINKKMD
jgi:hypothetical protein